MDRVHEAVGFAVVAGWGALLLWGAGAFIAKREPGRWFWRLLAVLQGVLLLQIVLGLILLVLRRALPSVLHLLYGSLFPAIVLVVAHVLGRGMEREEDAWKVFAIASFFLFGLTLRALTTGLGIG